jgi:hypothetical protein
MFTIIGGTYTEVCEHPRFNQVVGSGPRAAIAVSIIARSLSANDEERAVTLHTWASLHEQKKLKRQMDAYEVLAYARTRSEQIQFVYRHALHPPSLYPQLKILPSQPVDEIRAENALVFGMVDRSTCVTSNRLVYDPQGGNPVIPFSSSGHKAQHVAVVANMREAISMAEGLGWKPSGALTAVRVGKELIKRDGIEVVVIKDGIRGQGF